MLERHCRFPDVQMNKDRTKFPSDGRKQWNDSFYWSDQELASEKKVVGQTGNSDIYKDQPTWTIATMPQLKRVNRIFKLSMIYQRPNPFLNCSWKIVLEDKEKKTCLFDRAWW